MHLRACPFVHAALLVYTALNSRRAPPPLTTHYAQMELTLIALTSRALPLAPTRAALEGRLEASMQRLAGEDELAPGHKADLQRFISMFDGGWAWSAEVAGGGTAAAPVLGVGMRRWQHNAKLRYAPA